MKLASLKSGRDGRLVVVSTDLQRCLLAGEPSGPIGAKPAPADGMPSTLQAALDNWSEVRPALEELSERVNAGEGEPFDQAACHSPLPRAYQWADGSAYVNHVELVRRARGAEMPESFWTDPLMYQGGSDSFIGPQEAILAGSEDWGIDFEAEVAIVTGDVPMGVSADEALDYVRLVMIVNLSLIHISEPTRLC